jgi:hypothetical protein
MKKAKIFIIVFITVFLVVAIMLLFFTLTPLFEPWSELFHNNKPFVAGILFIIFMYIIGIRKWATWLKFIGFFILISIYSLTIGANIVDIAYSNPFVIGVIAFIVSLITYLIWCSYKKDQKEIDKRILLKEEKNIKKDEGEEAKKDDSDKSSSVLQTGIIFFGIVIFIIGGFALAPIISTGWLIASYVGFFIFFIILVYLNTHDFNILKIFSFIIIVLFAILLD